MSLLPSWVDAKNPPLWYNDGSDIDTLLEDADCLNWLSDTGDLDETYPPAMAEPAVVSSLNTAGTLSAGLEPTPVTTVHDPTSAVHLSTESLSFLVDPPDHHVVAPVALSHLPPFLHEEDSTAAVSMMGPAPLPYASATEAVEATSQQLEPSNTCPEHKLTGVGESVTNLMGFPDLDMGDEQAFVSALLENSGQSTMSFPKLGSDVHMHTASAVGNRSGVALGSVFAEEQPLNENA